MTGAARVLHLWRQGFRLGGGTGGSFRGSENRLLGAAAPSVDRRGSRLLLIVEGIRFSF